ncbi:MAG TPA: hypothetical protein VFV67_12420 [Actinophytocola sp.]|uniref:hypothetical protein n=1 Tax=Actinophytocola sp. TaxID=1872138 RepID=UPI002DB96838|nr:hypothetical protein [Actinophytocola sp.]HEU5471451.1 hypothetical protein [Actinophytocola sp.]
MGNPAAAQRLRLALDMYEAGERMQPQRLKRTHPQASGAEIDAELQTWRRHRPGATHGDCPGHPSPRFE